VGVRDRERERVFFLKGGVARMGTDVAGVMGHSVCDSRRPFLLQFFSILAVAASVGGAILYVHERTTHTHTKYTQTNTPPQ